MGHPKDEGMYRNTMAEVLEEGEGCEQSKELWSEAEAVV